MPENWFRKRKGWKSKDLGYGYTATCWQGWASIAVFTAFIFVIGWTSGLFTEETNENLTSYLIGVVVWTVIFIFFAKSRSED